MQPWNVSLQGVGMDGFLLVDTPCDGTGQGNDRAYAARDDRD